MSLHHERDTDLKGDNRFSGPGNEKHTASEKRERSRWGVHVGAPGVQICSDSLRNKMSTQIRVSAQHWIEMGLEFGNQSNSCKDVSFIYKSLAQS